MDASPFPTLPSQQPPVAHVIRSDAEALRVAEALRAFLEQGAAARDRTPAPPLA